MRYLVLALMMFSLSPPSSPARADSPVDHGRYAASDECPARGDAIDEPVHLARVTAALSQPTRLDVLAVGSGGLMAPRGHVGRSLPDRLVQILRTAVPGAEIRLVVQGGRGASANDMLALLRRELAAHRFDLVLWQTGTVEALRKAGPDAFRQTLDQGARLVHEQAGDLILIDPQFSRVLHAHADLAPYEHAFRDVAVQPGVTLFDRLDLTSRWVATGAIDLEKATAAERSRISEIQQECLAHALADMILKAAGVPLPQ